MKVLRAYLPSIVLIGVALSAIATFVLRYSVGSRVLRFAHVYEVSSPYHQQALWAAKELSKQTSGRYQLKVYPASSLGNEVSINEAVNLGSVDLIYTGPSLAAQRYGPLAISDYPYVIKDFAHWQAYRQSDLFEELSQGYKEATGDTVLSLAYYGFRHVTANKPIRTPEDMRNLKIRVPNALSFLMMPQHIGANPTPIPFSETYLALQQGVVDAQENPLTTIKYKRFYEVQNHISLTAHIANSLVVIAAGKTLSKMSEQDRKALETVIDDMSGRVTAEIRQQEMELLDWYPTQGVTVVEPDRQAFRAKVLPALSEPGVPFEPQHLARILALETRSERKSEAGEEAE